MDANSIAAFAAVAGLFLVAWQVKQQSTLQRKKVEEDYLRHLHSRIYEPFMALRAFAAEVADFVRARKIEAATDADYDPEIGHAARRLSDAFISFGVSASAAVDLAQAVERYTITSTYRALEAALRDLDQKVLQMATLIPSILRGEISGSELNQHATVRSAEESREVVARVISERLVQLYDIGAES